MSVNILLKRSATASKRPVGTSMVFGELNLNYDASTGGLYYKNSAGTVVKVGPCQVSATAPNSSPAGSAGNSAGEFWFDSSTDTLKVYNGADWVETGGSVQGVSGTAPITVDNTNPLTPVIGVSLGTTSAAGVLQLTDSVSSASTTTAATPKNVKEAYDLANAALPKVGGAMSGGLILNSELIDVFGSSGNDGFILSSTGSNIKWIANTVDGVQSVTGNAPITVNNTNPAAPVISVNTGSTSQLGALQVGTNVDVAAGVISIKTGSTVDLGVVQVGTNIDVATGVISVADSSTSVKGVVQLNDTTNSTSTTLALTAAQGKNLQDQIDALAVTSNLTLAGTFNASTGLVDSVTTAGTAANFVVGSALPSPAAGNADFFVIIDVAGSTGPAGTPPYHIGDWFLSTGTAWTLLNVGFQAPSASTSVEGIVYLATDAEVQAGSDTSNKAVIPSSLQSKLSDSVSTTSSTTIASSTAVKTAYDLADAAIPDSTFTAAGELLVGTGAGTYAPLSDGSAYQILTTDGAGVLSWVNNTVDGVQGITGTAPITIDNTDPANPIVEIDAATTSISGAVQLYDDVDSTSTSLAATANAVKIAYDAALLSGITSATTIYVNNTNGNDSTGERGTTKAFLTITAALAAATNGDTLFLSPSTFNENVTMTKSVNLVGTFNDPATESGTSILGNFVFNLVSPTATVAPSINHIRFSSPNTDPAFKVLANAFQSPGSTAINDCFFASASSTSVTEFAFDTEGTWTRSIYLRRNSFDGNIRHAAGTAAGANGYLVLDSTLGTGSSSRFYNISSGTVEFRRPSNALSPVFQTGGVVLFTDCITGFSSSNANTSSIFGGTGIGYKGSATSVGNGVVYWNGNAAVAGLVQIGDNLIYGWTALNVTPANLTISGSAVAYTTAVPAAADLVIASQQRPRFDLLTATSSVAAANQLATVIDSTTGTLHTVAALDAGVF